MNITHNNETLFIRKQRYGNNRIALLCSDNEGYPYATLTVNLPNEKIENNEAFIDTNNCSWALSELKNAGIITGEALRYARSGYCTYPLYKINL